MSTTKSVFGTTSTAVTANPFMLLLDFIEEIAAGNTDKARANVAVCATYLAFCICSAVVWHSPLCDGDFSAILTAGSGVQCMGFLLLLQKINSTASVAGISAKTLEMYGVMYVFRLASTLNRNGYLPVDRSGDHVYQAVDTCSLLLVLQLLYCVKAKYGDYQQDLDTLQVHYSVPACLLLGLCLHGHLDESFLFDSCWATSVYLDTIVLLPQLWMLVQKSEVEALTSHYIAAYFVSRSCSLAFWWFGYTELGPSDGMNVAGHLILLCHFAMLAISGDFMWHYLNFQLGTQCGGKGGKVAQLVLPSATEFEI